MHCDLWDTETSNYYGRFEDEAEVLRLVRKLVNHYGATYADDLGLGRVSDDGSVLEPLSGAALLARVDAVLGEPQEHHGGVPIASGLQTRRIGKS